MTARSVLRIEPQEPKRDLLASWRHVGWVGRVSAAVLVCCLLIILVGASLAPYSATELDPSHTLAGPSAAHWSGTDNFGRDVFSRILTGGRTTILLSLTCTVISMLIGTFVGLTCGVVRGTLDTIVMRFMDMLQSIPPLLIALLVLAVLGSSTPILVLAVALVFVPPVSRIARTAALQVSRLPFTEAARIRGEGTAGMILQEILPNAAPTLLVEAGLRVSHSILQLAALGFLGLGVQPPTPDWGLMVNEGRAYLGSAPWVALAPAAMIAVVVLSINIFLDEYRGTQS